MIKYHNVESRIRAQIITATSANIGSTGVGLLSVGTGESNSFGKGGIPVIIGTRDGDSVAVVAADELVGMLVTDVNVMAMRERV